MSQLPAFRELQAFIARETARKPRKPKAPKTESANALTRRIVTHIRANGGFASRLASTGAYRADIKKFVASQQVSGLPDVLACVNKRFIGIEVKVGRDVLSPQQKQTIGALEKAGALVFVARDFDSFQRWFSAEFLTPPIV